MAQSWCVHEGLLSYLFSQVDQVLCSFDCKATKLNQSKKQLQHWTDTFGFLHNLPDTHSLFLETENQTDMDCSFYPFVSSFYFCHLQSGDKGLEWTKSLQLYHPPQPDWVPQKKHTPHCKPPPTFRRPTPLHTHASQNKITLLLCWRWPGQQEQVLDCPDVSKVWAHRTLTLLKLLHRQETGITRINHWSLFLFFFLKGWGEEKKENYWF